MIKLQSITLPDGFLREESRDGYTISTKTKEVWAVELDLLKCFVDVCEKNNLRYFLAAGTLLGAVRHQGFIPWDIDIDVAMLYDDYARLREIAKSEFSEPYLYQSEYDFAQAGIRFPHDRLHNIETTAIGRGGFNMGFSHIQSIYIDIFPLVGMPPASERREYVREIRECERQMQAISRKRSNDTSVDIGDELVTQVAQMERIAARYPISLATKKIRLVAGSVDRDEMIFNSRDFQDTVPLPFEILTLAAPSGYKNILRNEYGIWTKPVPQFSYGNIFFDTDRPYKYWLSQPSLPED